MGIHAQSPNRNLPNYLRSKNCDVEYSGEKDGKIKRATCGIQIWGYGGSCGDRCSSSFLNSIFYKYDYINSTAVIICIDVNEKDQLEVLERWKVELIKEQYLPDEYMFCVLGYNKKNDGVYTTKNTRVFRTNILEMKRSKQYVTVVIHCNKSSSVVSNVVKKDLNDQTDDEIINNEFKKEVIKIFKGEKYFYYGELNYNKSVLEYLKHQKRIMELLFKSFVEKGNILKLNQYEVNEIERERLESRSFFKKVKSYLKFWE